MSGTAVGKIIPGDGSNDDKGQPQISRGFCHPYRFQGIERITLPVCNGTEPAVSGAGRAHDQKCGGLVRKTFPQVGASGLLTNRVEPVVFQQGADSLIGWSRRQSASEPVRFSVVDEQSASLIVWYFHETVLKPIPASFHQPHHLKRLRPVPRHQS